MSNNNIPENALFVCFSGMPNMGRLTSLPGLQAPRQFELGQTGIFRLGVLPTEDPIVLNKTCAA